MYNRNKKNTKPEGKGEVSKDERYDKPHYNSKSGGAKSKSNSRNKRNGNKSYDADKEEKSAVEYDNDPAWSIIDPELAKEAMGWPFSNFIGESVNLNFSNIHTSNGSTYPIKYSTAKIDIGSIMVLEANPSCGRVGTYGTWVGTDPKIAAINQQGFKMYSRLSSINSKNTQYGPQDVTTLMLAIGELISMVNWAQRTLGLAWLYNIRNRNMPKYLIACGGIDPDDLMSKLSTYRTLFNTKLVEANKIVFPSNINYFEKCAQIYNGVYKDAPSDMSQVYITRPYSTWDMDETGAQGTVLRTHVIPYVNSEIYKEIGVIKFSDLLDIIEEMTTNLMTSATYNYVYTDIINYASRNAGNANLQILHFAPVPEDYTVIPEYNEPMLAQIHNATLTGVPIADDAVPLGNNVFAGGTQNNDVVPDETHLCLTYQPLWVEDVPWWTMDKVVDFHENNPDINIRIEATRMMTGATGADVVVAPGNANDKKFVCETFISSDHYFVDAYIYTDNESGNYWYIRVPYLHNLSVNAIFPILQFREAPLLYKFSGDLAAAPHFDDVFGDLDVFTTLSPDVLDRMNTLAMYAMFEPKDFSLASERSMSNHQNRTK